MTTDPFTIRIEHLDTDPTIDQAIDEVTDHLEYLQEESLTLTLEGFRAHVQGNIDAIHEDGIQCAADAHSLGYYLDLLEGWDTIVAHWDTIEAAAVARYLAEGEGE